MKKYRTYRSAQAIKTLPQHTVIRKGKRMASIPTDASDEEKAKILKMLG